MINLIEISCKSLDSQNIILIKEKLNKLQINIENNNNMNIERSKVILKRKKSRTLLEVNKNK